MDAQQNQQLDQFINQKRAEKQSDDMILQELVAVGWDKTAVLQKLAGSGSAPTPSGISTPVPMPQGVVTTQTGGVGTPLQVENVQYNVKVGKVRSKIGFASFLMSLFLWVIAATVIGLLLAIRTKILPTKGDDLTDLGAQVVLSIAFLIPLAPIFWYTRKRLHKILAENPAAADDLFFKRSIRFHLVVSTLVGVCWIIVSLYNILAKIFLHNQEITGGVILDSIIFAGVFSGMAFYFLYYQNMTKR